MSLKAVVVGCGNMANDVHMPCILKYIGEHGGLQVIACADLNEDRASAFAQKYNIDQYFTDYNEMLDIIKPNVALCLVSEHVIYEVAANILNKGVDTFIEKPPGKNISELQYIINAEKSRKNIKTAVAFNRRFAPVYIKLKELYADKKVRHILYNMHRIRRHENHFESTAIHAVDAVKWLAGGEYTKVRIDYQEMPEKGEKVANYYIYGEFENGITTQINIAVSTGMSHESCKVLCDDSIFEADYISDNYGITKYAGGMFAGRISQDEICGREYIEYMGFYNEHKVFYDGILKNEPITSLPESAAQSVEICNALRERISHIQW